MEEVTQMLLAEDDDMVGWSRMPMARSCRLNISP
jgi:hypothetical protein